MTGRLFVSFWQLTLENVPPGTFRHHTLSAADAKTAIVLSRTAKTLQGVSGEDLFAPYNKHKAARHAELREALNIAHGIDLQLMDFTLDNEVSSTIYPLDLVKLTPVNQLLVINCGYSMSVREPPDNNDEWPLLRIDPYSIKFHLFEHVAG